MSVSTAAVSHLQEPPPDLRGFPRYALAPGIDICRIHPGHLGAWWFASDGRGRFDLVLRDGRGTCYLAQRPAGALLESFRGIRTVAEEDIRLRREFHVGVERRLSLANCCAPSAGRFGVNAELHSGLDYALTQRWAAAFDDHGFAGVRHFVRSDPSGTLIGYALFGPAGEPPAGAWPAGASCSIAPETIEDAARYGLAVRPTP